ncbi:MAG: hypothetical protein ACRECX_03115 [Methyloceanibacter sp.]|uniref:hypothetical protein n=1 Tax=Methyloceanibacter sp. TaxID=1965321 RepID=UPI003D6CF347
MTVCIAAVCGMGTPGGPFIVAAADRMITIGELEYEPAQTKTIALATLTIGLFAGDMLLHGAVVPRAIAKLKGGGYNTSDLKVSEIAEAYADEFANYRRGLAERHTLSPLNMTFDSFLRRQKDMAHYQVDIITDQLQSFSIDSTAIVAGLDSTGGHLYRVENPGRAMCYDTPFFVCTGAGEALARTQFVVSGFDKTWDLPSTIWLTFLAKARAESAGGVGSQTDMVLIAGGADTPIYPLKEEEKNLLYGLYENTLHDERMAAVKASDAIAEYIKAGLAAAATTGDATTQAATEATPVEEPSPKKDDAD